MTETNNFKMAGLRMRWLMTLGLLTCFCMGAFGQNVTVSGASAGNGTYPTLRDAFVAINVAGNNGSGPIDVLVHANTTETATATLDNFTWASVTVRCTSAVTIEGSIVGAIIKLNGADNVTIDGRIAGTGRNMTVRNNNTSSATAAIWLASVTATNGCTNNTIRNLEIACGADQSTSINITFGIAMCGTTLSVTANGTNNDNNTFTENRIIKCRFGIMTRGTITDNNFNIMVSKNIVGPSALGSDEIGMAGIYMQADSLSTVTENTVQFVGCLFAQTVTGFADKFGIAIGNNGYSNTSTTTITSGPYTVTNNLIHDIIEEHTGSAVGIYIATTRGTTGMTNNLIANNCLYNVRANGTGGDATAGIAHIGNRGDRIVFNSISMIGDLDPGTATSASASSNPIAVGIYKRSNGANDTAQTIKNNIIYMDLNSNTNTLLFSCIQTPVTHAWGTGGLDNNDYYFPVANIQGRTGGTGTAAPTFLTLANWQTAYVPAQDGASMAVDPLFTSATDLHINSGLTPTPLESGGANIAGVTTDVDGQTRPGPAGSVNGGASAPDIGCDEFDGVPQCFATATVSPTSSDLCSGSSVSLTASCTVNCGTSQTFTWAPAAGLSATTGASVTASPTATTTYTVSLTTNAGCTGTATASIAVNNNPIITNVSANPENVCSGSNSQLTTCALIPTAVNGYTYGTGTGTLDPMTGATIVVGSGVDDAPMALSGTIAGPSQALPFTFNLNGTDYTHYSASPDGWIRFSNSTAAAVSEFNNSVTSTLNIPKIYPYWDDVATGTTGNVTVVTTGTAPNRIFKVQWFVTIPRNTTGPANSTFQAWIHECGGAIQYVYGAMNASLMSASVGMTGNATNFQSVTISPNSVSIVTANNSNTGQPANGDMYSFTPASPTYSWSPATFLSSTSVASPLAVGVNATTTYTVTATGAGGCTATSTVTINTSTLICNTPTTTPACAGSNFTLTASHTGGGAPYTYLWNTGSTNASITDNQAAGTYTYTVTVSDNCGASCSSSVTVTVNTPPTVTASPSSGLICNPGGTAVSITASNAVTYTWAPAAGLSATTGATVSANPTATTTYTVTGTDANGCTGSATAVISVATTPDIAGISASPSTICAGGSSTLNVTHPLLSYCQTAYSSGTGFGDSITLVNILTTTLNNVTGGAPTPFYTLFPMSGSTTATLSAGTTYNMNVRGGSFSTCLIGAWLDYNNNGTFEVSEFLGVSPNCGSSTIVAFPAFTIPSGAVNGKMRLRLRSSDTSPGPSSGHSCGATNSGFGETEDYDVTITGGVDQYTYLWSNSATTQSTSVMPGATTTYTVTVTGAGGCTATASTTVTVLPSVTVTCSGTNSSCNGSNNGSASVTVNTGSAPFTYSWSNGSTDAMISGLMPSTYTVTVTDSCGTTATCSYTVTEPAVLMGNCSGTNVSCNGGSNGTASSAPTGGTAPYTYMWSNSTTDATATGLMANTYTVTVTDANGCTTTCSYTVTEPAVLMGNCSGTNVSCNGGSNGTASSAPTGGTAPYTYMWSNSTTDATATGLTANTYTVTVTDANGCIATCSYTVTEPAVLVGNCSGTNVSCNGGSNGTASSAPTGGTAPYTYMWSNSTTDATATGLMANTYTVTVTDANGCTATCSYTVTEPAALTASCSGTDNVCFGGNIGTASVTAGGGTTPYTYLWSNSSTDASQTALLAGTYTVTVTDANGCTATCSYTVTEPTAVVASCSGTNVSCNGGSNGSASVSATGGTPGYTYLWSNTGTDASQTGLAAGTYTVTVTDANGCTGTCSYTVTEPAVLLGNCTGTNVSCNGGSDGSATSTPSGGTSPYTYLWSNTSTDASITGLIAGTYTVTVTDANGCTATCSYTVTEPAVLTASCSGTDNVCFGGNIGTASVTAGGGTTPYTYLWSNLGTNASQTALLAGTYTVTVTDANGCTATCSYTVTEPTAVVASCSGTNASCNGGSNGSASVSASGGTPGYTYLWSNAGTDASQTGLTAGTYTVTVTDANGCTATCSYTVTEPSAVVASCSGTNVSCNGGSNGTASVSASGGTPGYTYLWSNTGTDASQTGLTAGTYTVTVTDANGCTATCSYTVTEPAVLSSTCSGTNVSCNGGNDGLASVSAANGTAPYSYLWSNGGTNASETGLMAGTYTVTVTDSCGATSTCSYTVTEPAVLAANCSGTNAFCAGGSVSSSPTGGTSPYAYLWNNGATTSAISGLSAGTYTVTVTDALGCTATCDFLVNVGAPITATCSGTNVSCNGGNNGSASVVAGGGTPPYTYAWDNGGTDASITALIAGNYCVTVTDSNGCTATCCYMVTEPSEVVAPTSGTMVSCNGGSDGTATVTPGGGTPGYTFVWSNGGTDATQTGLIVGTYTVTVTDTNGCTGTGTYMVTEPTVVTVTCTGTNVSCNAGSDGTASVTAGGGTPGYTYLWSNAGTDASQTGLMAGTYTVTVTDANGCTATCSYTVTEPAALTATCSGTNVSCNGGSDGSTSVTAGGGTPGYTYLWSTSGTDASQSGLVAGTYTVTVTDANGCTATCEQIVTEPAVLTVSLTPTNVTCLGGSDGSIAAAPAGGTMAYSYLWSDGQTDATAMNLVSGTYTVTVTDANGCTATASATIAHNFVIPAMPGVITGPTPVCRNTTQAFSIAPVPGATTYTWTAPAGASVSSGQGTTNVTIFFSNTSVTGNVSVTAGNVCGNSAPRTFLVTVVPNKPAMPTITGLQNGVCGRKNLVYTCSVVAGATSYTWTVPTGATLASGQGTNSIVVHFGNTFTGSGFITVTANNVCGSSNVRSYFVGGKLPTPVITGLNWACPDSIRTYSVAPITGATSYTWTVVPGSTLLSGQGTTSITVKWGIINGVIKVKANSVSVCSGSNTAQKPVSFTCIREGNELFGSLGVYPNPTDNLTVIDFDAFETSEGSLQVYNMLGSLVHDKAISVSEGRNRLELNVQNFAPGAYIIKVSSKGTTKTARLIVE